MRSVFALATLAVAALANTVDLKCPDVMSYCGWTRSCQCPIGTKFDLDVGKCVGTKQVGCWDKPDVSIYADIDIKIELGAVCAKSPYQIAPYEKNHPYCQKGLDTIAILVDVKAIDALVALKLDVGVAIAVDAIVDLDVDLKVVVEALAAIYIEAAVDAEALYNDKKYGLVVVDAQIEASVGALIWAKIKARLDILGINLDLFLGLNLFGAAKSYDCVKLCTKGCPNYIDLDAEVGVGADILGLVGIAIYDKTILHVNSLKVVVALNIEALLCVVGKILTSLLSLFDCGCK